jgi:hypothetical protein
MKIGIFGIKSGATIPENRANISGADKRDRAIWQSLGDIAHSGVRVETIVDVGGVGLSDH